MTLYEMTNQAAALYELLAAEEIDEQVYCDTLESIGAEEKIDSYCKIVRTIEADNTAIDAEIARLTAIKKRNIKSIARMKTALDGFMRATNSDKQKTPLFTVSYKKSDAVEITDLSAVPEIYINVKTERNPDKMAIKKAIKSGEKVPGAELKINMNIQIK